MWKLTIVIYTWLFIIWKFIGKFIKLVFWVLMEIYKIGLEIYYFPQNVPKMMKNAWKYARSFVKSKREPKYRNFYKIRSRRAENRNFKVSGNKMDNLKPIGILKSDDENVEKGRSGRKGKTIFFS